MIRPRHIVGLAIGFVLVVGQAATATTFVLMDVADLAEVADLGVLGRIESIHSAEGDRRSISTDVLVEVQRVAFGDAVPDDFVVVRQPGGFAAGRREWVFGSPSFALGEQVFLFLNRIEGGYYTTSGLSMGKYRVIDSPQGTLAVRSVGVGVRVVTSVVAERPRQSVDSEMRLTKLMAASRRAHRRHHPGDRRRRRPARAAVPQAGQVVSEFGFRLSATLPKFLDPPSRWFEPDDGLPVRYFVDSTGDDTLGPEISGNAVDAAFAAWSAVETAGIELASAGPTDPAPFSGCPDDNRIVFNDPFGEIQNPTNCRGILAFGGFCETGEKRTVNGVEFQRIVTGKLTLNNGWGGCPIWTACGLAEIATHEIGHTLGLGHSADLDATMATDAHFDGRCASLRSDDKAGVTFMYPRPTETATATATSSNTATATDTPSVTNTPSATGTSTWTPRPPTPSRTFTRTLTPTRTRTPTNTRPPTRTPTGSRPPTATSTATATATSSPTPTTPVGDPFVSLMLRALRRLLENLLALFS